MREDDIRRPDGTPGIYSVVDKPTYALVIPYDGERFALVEQFRYKVGARRWEFPQGTAPDLAHSAPNELVQRELQEGYHRGRTRPRVVDAQSVAAFALFMLR